MLTASLRPPNWSPENAGDLRTILDTELGVKFLQRIVFVAPAASELASSTRGNADYKLGYLDGWEQAITAIKFLSSVESADSPELSATPAKEEYPSLDDDSAWNDKSE